MADQDEFVTVDIAPSDQFVEHDIQSPSDFVEVDITPSKGIQLQRELPYPSGLEQALPTQQPAVESPSILSQVLQIPKLVREVGAETGLTTAGGFEASRARALREEAKSPVGFEGRLIGQAGVPRTAEARLANAIDRANIFSSKRAEESSQDFLQAASAAPEEYGLDPMLETGLVTQAARGLTKGAGMFAVASATGIPGLALAGSTEAYGAAKAHGKSDDEADKEATRALIALAIFGGSNKIVSSGIARYLGNASKLRTFLTQTAGQTAGNEATSRAISAYEAALDAEPGKRMDAAAAALSKMDAGSIAQNIGFALMGGLEAAKRGTAAPAEPLVKPEERFIPAAEVPQEIPRGTVDLQAGVVRDAEGTPHEVTETGLTEVVPGSPKDVSMTVLGTKEPPKGKQSAISQITQPQGIRTESEIGVTRGQAEEAGVGNRLQRGEEGRGQPVVAEAPPSQTQPPPVTANDFVPALIIGGEVVRGQKGDTHKTIFDRYVAEHGKEGKEFENATLALADDSTHIFESSDGQPMTRQEVSDALGEKAPMQSEKLRELQAKAEVSKEPTVAKPIEPPEAMPPGPLEIPIEDRGRPPIETPTGIRNAKVDAARISQGLPPRMGPLRKTFGAEWDKAMEIVEANPDAGSALVSELAKTSRSLTPTESALLAHEQVTRENAYNDTLRAVNEAPNEAARRAAETALSRARDRNQEVYDAGQRAGTESGQSLAFRKMLVNRDYSLTAMETEVRALKGGDPLSTKEIADVKALHDRIKLAEDRARAAEEQLARRTGEREFSKLLKSARQEASAARREGKSILDRIISNGEMAAKRLRERHASGRSMTSVTLIDPVDFSDYVQIGAGYIAKGIKGLAEFTTRLVKDFGKTVEPHAERIFGAATQYHRKATEAGPKVRSASEAAARDKETERLDPNVVYDVARAHVNAGVEGFDNVMAATRDTLATNRPDLTIREVRDAFSGYGKVTRPSQAADRVKLREYRRLGQLASAIEDAQKKIAPMKSGPQRDKATETVRAKMAELKRVMEENGIQVTSPEQQLANAEKAATTRLQNSIESLERQIATKTRDAVAKGKRVATPEIEKLRTRVEELKKTLDEVSPRPEETDAQRVQKSITSVEARIAELDNQLKTGAAPAGKVPGPTSPKLERLRAERDAMSGLVRELREAAAGKKSPEQRKIDQALKSVDQQIAELDRQLKTGDVQVKPSERQVTSPKLEAKRAERDAMRRLRDDIRNLSKPKLTPDQRAIKAVEKSIAELDRQIKEGGTKVPSGTSVEPSATLEALRSERDSMRSLLKEIRETGKTKRSPEEIALSRYKKTLATRTKALQDRMIKGDYEKKPKKETALDKEALDARFQYQKAKDAYEQKVFEYDLARRSGLQKAADYTMEVVNLSRAIMTSTDFSAPLRQGAFITLAHPIRSLKSFPAMFKAFASERQAFKIQESLSDPAQRPNAALYRQAGLDLSETGPGVTRRKLEEMYQSRWAKKIPIVAGSERAYTTFLNLLRADSFDAMVKNLGTKGKVTDAEAKAIANFVNVATGRAKFGQRLEQATQGLNLAFFAPKYVLSRFQLLAGQPFYKGTARTRMAVAKEYARFLIGAGTVIGLAQLAGATVSDDPKSTDFGKIKIGNTRVDLFAGLSQATVLGTRIATGKETTSRGKVVSLRTKEGERHKFGQPSTTDVLFRFLRTKFSPALSAGVNIAEGRDVTGQPTTPVKEIGRLGVPLVFRDVQDAMKGDNVPTDLAISLLGIFGAGVSNYDVNRRQ